MDTTVLVESNTLRSLDHEYFGCVILSHHKIFINAPNLRHLAYKGVANGLDIIQGLNSLVRAKLLISYHDLLVPHVVKVLNGVQSVESRCLCVYIPDVCLFYSEL